MNIENYIRAGYPAIYCITAEEIRLQKELLAICKKIKRKLYLWSCTSGLFRLSTLKTIGGEEFMDPGNLFMAIIKEKDSPVENDDPIEIPLTFSGNEPEKKKTKKDDGLYFKNAIILMRDFHMLWEESNPALVRLFKESIQKLKSKGATIIFCGCRQVLPPEVEKEVVVVEMELPDKDALREVLSEVVSNVNLQLDFLEKETVDNVIENSCGMTLSEAENAYSLSLVEKKGNLCPELIYREKSQVVKKSGLLEIMNAEESIDAIGGLDLLKDYLLKRQNAFTPEAKEWGLPTPKGLLIIGLPGTGKSLTAKATAKILQRPLLRMDAGKIFGSLVGESESNLRMIQRTAEAIAPCVLFIDEIEKAFSGGGNSAISDGGTSNRVFGSFLSWLQDKTAPVFVIATANDISQLRPEFIRPGRFDQVFFVDLPNVEERKAIWEIQINKHCRNNQLEKGFALKAEAKRLAELSESYTGAEIEQAIIDSLYESFAGGFKVTPKVILDCLRRIIPLSVTMKEQIQSLREWCRNRARPASVVLEAPEEAKEGAIPEVFQRRTISMA